MSTSESSSISGGAESPTSDISECYVASITVLSKQWTTLNDSALSSSAWSTQSYDKSLETQSKEYGRLRAWGEETRAVLPAASRGSLDDTLRKDPELKRTVNGI